MPNYYFYSNPYPKFSDENSFYFNSLIDLNLSEKTLLHQENVTKRQITSENF